MKMVSLKLPKKKTEVKSIETVAPSMPSEQYPYSTRITLDGDIVDKLSELEGVGAGDIVTIKAKAKVIEVMERETDRVGEEKKQENRVELQLTDIAVAADTDGEMDAGFNSEADTKED